MKVHLTRDSVANGDDAYPKDLIVGNDAELAEILRVVSHSNFLASIAGGEATWSAVSKIPLAVLAQQWIEPKILTLSETLPTALDFADNTLFLHFNYHAQQDPEVVYEVLRRFQLPRRGNWR